MLRLTVVLLVLITLVGCSSQPAQPTGTAQPAAAPAPQKETTLYTGKGCFNSMVSLAQRWQPDAMPFHLESDFNADATGQEGKATVWRGFFASRGRGMMKSFICSGSRLADAPPNGFSDTAETAYGGNVPALMFLPSYFLVDSDKAYAATLDHGGKPLIEKNAKQPVIYLLDWDPKKKELVWTVLFGKSQSDRQGVALISARTGSFIGGAK
jgi:hypothetical protein